MEPTEFENLLSLDSQVKSSVATRWERKAADASKSNRYISNRSGMEQSTPDESADTTSEHAK